MVIRDKGNHDNDHETNELQLFVTEIKGHHQVMLQKFETMDAKFDDMSHQLRSVVDTLDRHMYEEDKEIKIIKDTLLSAVNNVEEKVLSGFPQKDPIRHHDYHVDIIDSKADRKKLIIEVTTFVVKSIVWAAIVVTGLAIWSYFKIQVAL
jgi:hypothetical protein